MVSDFYQHPDLYDALLPVKAHLPFYVELARQHAGSRLRRLLQSSQRAAARSAAVVASATTWVSRPP